MGPKQVTRPDGAAQTAGKKRQAGAADYHDNQSGSSNGAGRPNKKAKARVDRSIPVQASAADALTADGEVNLPQFLEALHDSIGGLEAAMRRSRASGTSRAFQQVPRDLRRRTASHNPKRVPARLRARAKAEMAADNTPLKPKKKHQGVARALDKSRKARRLLLTVLAETARLRDSLLDAAEGQAATTGDCGSVAAGASSGKTGETRALKAQVENLGNALAKTRELAKSLDREEPHLGDETSSRTEQINFIVSKAKKFAQVSAKSKRLNELLSEISKHGEALPTEKLGQALAKTKKLNKVIKEASKLEEQEPPDREDEAMSEAGKTIADSMQLDDEDVAMGDTDPDMPDPSPARDGGNREKKGQLPTHIWHAKRAKISTRDNPFFSKPTPLNMNTKTVRKMHRAYYTSAFMRDASHRGFIQLSGSADDLKMVLNSVGVRPKGATADWVRGCRVWVGIVCGTGSSGHPEDVTPARAIWDPPPMRAASAEAPPEQRQVLIEVEPETEERVLELLKSAAKPLYGKPGPVTMRSLSTELGCIDLHGPGATGKLLSVARPHHPSDAEGCESTHWRLLWALKRAQMDMLGYNICLGLSVAPPDRPPPDRTAARNEGADDEIEELLAAQEAWATEANPRPFALLDPARRFKALHAIRRKQSQNVDKDGKDDADPIPILLVCSRPQAHGLGPGWTLICQREAVKTFWLRLASQKTGPGAARPMEVACFEETHRIHTERGVPFFPVDFPATRAGLTWELKERERLRNEWERRPKGKRTSWKSLDLRPQGCRDGSGHKGEHGDPFACDWEHLFALSSKPVKDEHVENMEAKLSKKKQRDEQPRTSPPATDAGSHPLTGSITNVRPSSVRDYIAAAARSLREEVPQPTAVPEFGLVTVQVTTLGGGVPNPRARVYTLPDEKNTEHRALRERWLGEFEATRSSGKTGKQLSPNSSNRRFPKLLGLEDRKQMLAASLFGGTDAIGAAGGQQSERAATPLAVLEADLVGFVTSGGYNLATGRGQAVAHLSAARIVALGAAAAVAAAVVKEGGGNWHRCIVRNVGETLCRPAVWKLVEEYRGVN